METMDVQWFDSTKNEWRKAKVSTTSDVAKALAGEPGEYNDALRSFYKPITED